MSKVDEIAHDYLRRNSDLDPTSATARGFLGHDTELTDYSPNGAGARGELARSTLRQVEELTPETDADRLAAAVMRDRLQVEVDVYDSGDWKRELSVFGPMVSASRVFDLMARDQEHDWELIAERMDKVSDCMAGIQETLELGAGQDLVADRHQAIISASRARRWAGSDSEAGFFRGLAAQYQGQSEQLRSRLQGAAEIADRAYLDFSDFLEESYIERTPDQDGCGPELYQLHCRLYNGIEIDT
ncbi:MAG: DUF885 family protein, partial [Candidatus Dormiibacterota bacterium]